MGKTFALIGAAGYVAPRHMAAIREVGGDLLAALDPHDSVGVLDHYWPGCLYFREPERFDRWLSKHPVDYVVVCSPNYLHDAHCLMAMRNNCNVICEKPLVLYERNLDNLAEWQGRTGQTVNVILQCRLHPSAVEAERWVEDQAQPCAVTVDYRTFRGQWYDFSWKADPVRSGGLLSNIGIHLFDLACWMFGEPTAHTLAMSFPRRMAGHVGFADTDMAWVLSVQGDARVRMFEIQSNGDSFTVDLSGGFESLHTESYRRILAGHGFGIEDIRPATRLVERLRDAN